MTPQDPGRRDPRDEPTLPPDDLRQLIGLALRAARKRLWLNQREFAELVGLSRATIGRLEAAQQDVRVSVAQQALAGAGLQLTVTDSAGHAWDAESQALSTDLEGIADQAGRRLPAHLSTEKVRHLPSWRLTRAMRSSGPLPPLGPTWTFHRR